MNRKERRRFELEAYKRKWGILDYRAFVKCSDRNNNVFLVHKDASVKRVLHKVNPYSSIFFQPDDLENDPGFVEMVAIGSFLRRVQAKEVKITIYEANDTFQSFESIDDVKHYMLIQKIAGV